MPLHKLLANEEECMILLQYTVCLRTATAHPGMTLRLTGGKFQEVVKIGAIRKVTVEASSIFQLVGDITVTSKIWNVKMVSQIQGLLIFILNQVLKLITRVSSKYYVLQLLFLLTGVS